MSRRSSLLLVVVLAACGGAERLDTSAPGDTAAGCPSSAAPERCRELAASAASSGHTQLAWAYTVLECQSPASTQCTVMWQSYAKLAPTQTDALNVLHAACDHLPAACQQMATWHTERGHVIAAAAYRKRAEASSHASAAGSAAQPPHSSEAIDQMVMQAQPAPVLHAATATAQRPKAWSMRAAAGTHSQGCAATAPRDHHDVPLDQCIVEVRPFDGAQIAILNRCSAAVNVAYFGASSGRSPVASQLRLDSHEARSIGISHHDVGTLTYAVCSDGCRITGSDTTAWASPDAMYDCSRLGP